MATAEQLKQLIAKQIDCTHLEVYSPDEVHFEALVVSGLFNDLSLVKQHQLVYQALGNRLQAEVHALALKTLTPEQYESD